ncbi:MAG: transporter substrate-binding domain-containing protein [Vallitaleaceae bacterium]|nr:transporter substrate-binding domain-containing protein [Vallitaleaceae bacterium]
MKRTLIALLAVLLIFSGCIKKSESVLDKDTIKVGMELQYPPFETKDTSGNPDGASVMLAKALGEYLGKEVEIIDTPYPSLIPALETGSIDIIISSMTITEEREEKVDFSIPYTNSQLMMLVHKDSVVKSPADVNSEEVIIASKTGTIGALWAAANAPKAKVVNLEEEAAAVLEVAQGKADVFIYDPLSIIRHQANYPDTTLAILEPLPNTKGWGIALRKGDEKFKEKLNEFINAAKKDGTYDNIRATYLQDKIQEFEQYGLEFFF